MKHYILLCLSVALLMSCNKDQSKESSNQKQSNPKAPTKLVVAIGRVEPQEGIIKLSAPVGGIVKKVMKDDGDKVQLNEVILQLDDDTEQNKINELKVKIATQRTQINISQSKVAEVTANLQNKKLLLERAKQLIAKGAETQQVYDNLTTDQEVLEANLSAAKTQVQLANSELNELQTQLQTLYREANKKIFRAPFSGIILDRTVNQGESVSQFASYAEVAPQGKLIIRAEVDEMFSSSIKIGDTVEIVNIGSSNVIAKGKISSMAPYLKKKSLFSEKADDQEDRRVREIRISVVDDKNLVINAKIECNIKL
ncbi:HlyD family efflux transporter periplasmic adaptor subunit [Flectobacillus sp. DC10W]|uniref:HlyD family efflux transporter periplasmic adaptor subunit n=1 Tax=Flectobacillus longus TaxID=2984207 RepID=A0ABT6YUP6_9BACT|nr:HlyD family efflux transporter periplasmic adaptor subunit [Flectobacillus longus]MDI9867318.1 HlyD family efflux transporter periplasmic adaptor subunit [Flectobacillus longus]